MFKAGLEAGFNNVKMCAQYPDPEVFGFHENAAITKNQNSM